MGFFDPREMDLQEQVRMLGNEVASLRKAAAKRGSNLYDQASETASDYYADIADAIRAALPGFRKRARAAETAAFQNPAVVAAIGLVVIGLAASILFRRRSPAPVRSQRAERQRPARAATTRNSSRSAASSSRAAPRKRAAGPTSNGEANASQPDAEA
jgi:hypothetical protein